MFERRMATFALRGATPITIRLDEEQGSRL
jgi:hypothetical protein